MSFVTNLSRHIGEQVVNRVDGRTEEDIPVIAYGVNVILSNVIRITLMSLLVWFLGYIQPFLIVTALVTLLRIFFGGLHLDNSLVCFFWTLIYYSSPVVAATYLDLKGTSPYYWLGTILLIGLTAIYAPSDNKERPFLNRAHRHRLKVLSVISAGAVLILNPIFASTLYLFRLIAFSVVLSVYFVTPLAYRFHGRRYRNYDYADDYVG